MRVLHRLTSARLARQVAPIGRSIGALIAASVGGVAISFSGGFGWSFLARANRRNLPEVPWAACSMLAIIALAWWWFVRYRWTRTRPNRAVGTFHQLWPARSVAPPRWLLLAILATIVFLLSAIFLGMRIGHFTEDSFATSVNPRALPPQLAWSSVVMASLVAGFFEECGFRGFMQHPLERRFGPAFAIGFTSLFFYAIHLVHGWALGDLTSVVAIAVPMVLAGACLGLLARLTGALGPSIVAHTAIDLVSLPLEWNLIGGVDVAPLVMTGIDRHFVVWSAALLISAGVLPWSFVRLWRSAMNHQVGITG